MFDWCKWRLPVIIKEDEIQNKKNFTPERETN